MRRWLILGTLLGLPACAGPGPAPSGPDTPATGNETPDRAAAAAARLERLERVEPPPAGGATGEVPVNLLENIRADAAARLGVEPGELVVLRGESVTWNDGSLGCPRPDVVYTQALEPGYWIVLQAGDRQLDYRARRQGTFLLCESSREKGLPR